MSYTEREPRRAVELNIEMKDFSFIKTAEESALNLSQGGAFIKMDEPYPSGTLVKFKMTAPDKSVIGGVGKVAWMRDSENGDGAPTGVGIKFLKLSDEARKQLEQVLEGAEIISAQEKPALPEAPPSKETRSYEMPESEESNEGETASDETGRSSAPPKRTSSVPPEKTSSVPPPTKVSKPPLAEETFPIEKKSKRRSIPPHVDKGLNDKKTEVMLFVPEEIKAQHNIKTSSAPPKSTMELNDDEFPNTPAPSSGNGKKLAALAAVGIVILVLIWATAGGDKSTDTPSQSPSADETAAAQKPEPPKTKAEELSAPPTVAAVDEPAQAEPAAAAEAPPADEAAADEVAPADEAAADQATPGDESASNPAADSSLMPVTVTLSPEDAVLTVNGAVQEGKSPYTVQLPKGKEATISARAAGFISYNEPFTPGEETASLEIELSAARIKFQISSTPPGARILIDGKFNGNTPYTFLRRKYKPYNYVIEKRGFETVEGTVSESDWVEDGRYYVFTLDAKLERKGADKDSD